MNLLRYITPCCITADVSLREFRALHAAMGLPHWAMWVPGWVISGRVNRAMVERITE